MSVESGGNGRPRVSACIIAFNEEDRIADCIRCGRCDPVCPEGLAVEKLWWVSRQADLTDAVAAGLDDCIECGLCNPPCPADLDLAGTFSAARARLADQRRADADREIARGHVAEREARLGREAARKNDRRRARLQRLKQSQSGGGSAGG